METADSQASIAGLVGEVATGCLMTRARRISRVITGIYDEALRPYGLTSSQFSLMVLVAGMDGASRAEISRANHQERSTLTRNLSLLQAEHWIEEGHPASGRRRPIHITDAGRAKLRSAGGAWRQAQVKAKRLLGDSGAATLIGLATTLPTD